MPVFFEDQKSFLLGETSSAVFANLESKKFHAVRSLENFHVQRDGSIRCRKGLVEAANLRDSVEAYIEHKGFRFFYQGGRVKAQKKFSGNVVSAELSFSMTRLNYYDFDQIVNPRSPTLLPSSYFSEIFAEGINSWPAVSSEFAGLKVIDDVLHVFFKDGPFFRIFIENDLVIVSPFYSWAEKNVSFVFERFPFSGTVDRHRWSDVLFKRDSANKYIPFSYEGSGSEFVPLYIFDLKPDGSACKVCLDLSKPFGTRTYYLRDKVGLKDYFAKRMPIIFNAGFQNERVDSTDETPTQSEQNVVFKGYMGQTDRFYMLVPTGQSPERGSEISPWMPVENWATRAADYIECQLVRFGIKPPLTGPGIGGQRSLIMGPRQDQVSSNLISLNLPAAEARKETSTTRSPSFGRETPEREPPRSTYWQSQLERQQSILDFVGRFRLSASTPYVMITRRRYYQELISRYEGYVDQVLSGGFPIPAIVRPSAAYTAFELEREYMEKAAREAAGERNIG